MNTKTFDRHVARIVTEELPFLEWGEGAALEEIVQRAINCSWTRQPLSAPFLPRAKSKDGDEDSPSRRDAPRLEFLAKNSSITICR